MAEHDPQIDAVSQYARDRDRGRRIEPDLPATGPEAPRHTGPMPADLDALFGIGQRTTTAAAERRIRDTERQ